MLAFRFIGGIFLVLVVGSLLGLKLWLWLETPATVGTNAQRIKFKTFIAMRSMAPIKWKWGYGTRNLIYYIPTEYKKDNWYDQNIGYYEFYFTGLDIIRFYNWKRQQKLNEKRKADCAITAKLLEYWQQDIEDNKIEAHRQLEAMMNKNTFNIHND